MSYAFLGATAITSDTVKALQNQANAVLTPQGYVALDPDGKIGPKTCGAIQETAKFDGGALLAQATQAAGGNLASICTSFTKPTLKAGANPQPTTPSSQVIDLDQPTPAPSSSSSFLPSNVDPKKVMIAGALVAGVVVLVYASKRKPKKTAAA